MKENRLEEYNILNGRNWSIYYNGTLNVSLKKMSSEEIENFDRDYTDMINTFVAKDKEDTKIIAIKKVLAEGQLDTFQVVRAMMKSLHRPYSGRDSWGDGILFDTIIDGDVPFNVNCEFVDGVTAPEGAMVIMGTYTADSGTDRSMKWMIAGIQYPQISLPYRLSRAGVLRLPSNIVLFNRQRFRIEADDDIELIGVKISTGDRFRKSPRIVKKVKV